MRTLFFIGTIFYSTFSAFAVDKKTIDLIRVEDKVQIDGVLSESIWAGLPIAADFIQYTPVAGASSIRQTQVQIAYDNQAIYVGATMFDDGDSITTTLSQRDDVGNADWFGVIFDTYNAGTIGFSFIVTSAGVQVDELHRVEDYDPNWNAVWQSAVKINADSWVAEIKIPFSALRFPKNSDQTWGINFARNIRRKREESYWNFYDPKGINLISQLGQLNGVKDVDSPVRLSISPYVSGYAEHSGLTGQTTYTANGGTDLKYGLNESFTLDVTLIPDFGQVQFDAQILNLSPFEVRYNERRQFFTEGTELFNKGDLFYSRRIGGTPFNSYAPYENLDSNEVVVSNPGSTQLLNATKLSGRTQKGLGIGFFNAISASTNAEILNVSTNEKRFVETNPLTNYNVLVFDQNLKNNSSITLLNTNVMRSGFAYDANVTMANYNLYTQGQKYQTYGRFTVSQLFHQDSLTLGHLANFGFGKAAGQWWWNVDYSESSRNYNPNDLGYFFITNQRNLNLATGYNIFKPFWRLYNMWSSLNVTYSRNIFPEAFANFVIVGECGGTFRNFLTAGMWTQIEPVITFDYYEPRIIGRAYEYPRNARIGGFLSSDYSKPFAIDLRGAFFKFEDYKRFYTELEISPRIRFNDKIFMVLSAYAALHQNEEGAAIDISYNLPMDGDDPIFAIRDRLTVENSIAASYIFNNKMGVTFILRHYWSKVDYSTFYRLDLDGKFQPTTYTGYDAGDNSLHNNSFNAFTIDMTYRWVFAPGSEMNLVWKNSIFNSNQLIANNYFQNVNDMFVQPATNSISLKVIYYLDYWTLKQKIASKKTE